MRVAILCVGEKCKRGVEANATWSAKAGLIAQLEVVILGLVPRMTSLGV
jgi:hypothetical protein